MATRDNPASKASAGAANPSKNKNARAPAIHFFMVINLHTANAVCFPNECVRINCLILYHIPSGLFLTHCEYSPVSAAKKQKKRLHACCFVHMEIRAGLPRGRLKAKTDWEAPWGKPPADKGPAFTAPGPTQQRYFKSGRPQGLPPQVQIACSRISHRRPKGRHGYISQVIIWMISRSVSRMPSRPKRAMLRMVFSTPAATKPSPL